MMEKVLQEILAEQNIEQNKITNSTISKLIDNAKISELAKSMTSIKNQIMDIFNMYRDKEEFKEKHFSLPNANAKKEYKHTIDLSEFPDIVIKEIQNLEVLRLQFDKDSNTVYGTPIIASTIDLRIVFYNLKDENKSEEIKIVPFIVNADPKDLWLNKASDQNAKYAKKDEDFYAGSFLDKNIIVASKRGRSHAHEGSFRDDDFRVEQLADGWTIVAVADGAGSAKYAREGSKIATDFICEAFNNEENLNVLSSAITSYYNESETNEEENVKLKSLVINALYKEVKGVHNHLIEFSQAEEISLKDLNTTLIFALCKKFEFGYVVLTFGVGDCPINILLNNEEEVHLLNILDVGEFGGGTRFITMPEIFTNEIGKRFSMNKYDSFDKLFLMTDGIYDPKFITENKLEDVDTWKSFIEDLNGKNDDSVSVNLADPKAAQKELLTWLDFWSKGNHDDRTLAIIY